MTTKKTPDAAMQKTVQDNKPTKQDPAVWLAQPIGNADAMVHVVKYIEKGLADVSNRAIDGERLAQLGMLLKMSAQKVPALLNGTRLSLMWALLDLARMRLLPDGEHAALVPYKNQIQAIPMYKGLIDIVAEECGAQTQAFCVFRGEIFEPMLGTEQRIRHVFNPEVKRHDDNVIAAYAVFTVPGRRPTFDVMSREEIEKRRAMSKTAGREDSPWNLWFAEKAKVTVIKRGTKQLAKAGPRFQAATEADHRADAGLASWSAELGDVRIDGAQGPAPSNRGNAALAERIGVNDTVPTPPPPRDDGEELGVPAPKTEAKPAETKPPEVLTPDAVNAADAAAEIASEITDEQRTRILNLCDKAGGDGATATGRLRLVGTALGREVSALGELTSVEAARVINALSGKDAAVKGGAT